MRKLNPDEEKMWRRVASTIRPLGDSSPPPATNKGTDSDLPPIRVRRPEPPPRPLIERGRSISGNLDSHWERRIRAGEIEADRELDLHGMTLDSAWLAIDQAIERALRAGERVILLVTGRERKPEESSGRGRIRASVQDWLAASRHADHIAAVRSAHRRNGGGGSLYIILRRR